MKITLEHLKTPRPTRPPIVLLYGTDGVGKSTAGLVGTSDPILLPTEPVRDKFHQTPQFDLCNSFEEADAALDFLLREAHDFKTLVVDSIDWLEALIFDRVGRDNGKAFAEIGYGKGYVAASVLFRGFLKKIQTLNTTRKMTVVLIAHSKIERVEPPDNEPYDKYSIDLHKDLAPTCREFCDAIFFVNFKVFVSKKQNSEATRATGRGDRVMYTQAKPAFYAKNPWGLPDELPFEEGKVWETFRAAVKKQ